MLPIFKQEEEEQAESQIVKSVFKQYWGLKMNITIIIPPFYNALTIYEVTKTHKLFKNIFELAEASGFKSSRYMSTLHSF